MKRLLLLLIILLIVACQKLEISRLNKIFTGSYEINTIGLIMYGKVVDLKEESNIIFGHHWGIDTLNFQPLINPNPIQQGSFISQVSDLQVNQVYFYRAFISNANNELTTGVWKSLIYSEDLVNVQTETFDLNLLSQTSANVSGSISGISGLIASEYGHCWGESPLPTINNSRTNFGSSNENRTFESNLENLSPGITYHIRSYAKLGENYVMYGNELTFNISELSVVTNMHNINSNVAVLSGTIETLSVTPVIDHGHCWAVNTSNPNINNNKLSLGMTSQTGNYFNNLTLQSGITYYYRAYAVTENNVKYGIIRKIEF